jgi:bifunctional DNA-binding transcriptional regulator/antitoxin component of YhaV-PrlF toxin-antitoxin module
MSDTEREFTTPEYDRETSVELTDRKVSSRGRIRIPADVRKEHDLCACVVDAVLDYGPGTVPLMDVQTTKDGRLQIPTRIRDRYGIESGMLVDVTIKGVIEDV